MMAQSSQMLYFVYPLCLEKTLWHQYHHFHVFPFSAFCCSILPILYFFSHFPFSCLPEYLYTQTFQPGVTFESVWGIKLCNSVYDSSLSRRQPRFWLSLNLYLSGHYIISSYFCFQVISMLFTGSTSHFATGTYTKRRPS